MKKYIALAVTLVFGITLSPAAKRRLAGVASSSSESKSDGRRTESQEWWNTNPDELVDKWGLPIEEIAATKVFFQPRADLCNEKFNPEIWRFYHAYVTQIRVDDDQDFTQEDLTATAKLIKINANLRDETGLTPLHKLARWSGNSSIAEQCLKEMKVLIKHRADVNAQDGQFGRSVLHDAAFAGNPLVVRYLVFTCRARIDLTDVQGKTALDHAKAFLSTDNPNHRAVVMALYEAQQQADSSSESDDASKKPDIIRQESFANIPSPYGLSSNYPPSSSASPTSPQQTSSEIKETDR